MVEGSLRRELEANISRQATANELAEFAALCEMRPGMEENHWIDALGALARLASEGYAWLSAGEGAMLRFGAGRQVVIALTDCWPYQLDAIEEQVLKELIGFFINWLETQNDERVCAFCWALMRAQPRRQGSTAQSPIYWLLRSGRLKGDIELPSLELAVTLTDEEGAMFWWPEERWKAANWQDCSKPYLHFLEHGSSLVRAAAAKALGRLHAGLRDRAKTPALPQLLLEIADREANSPGVAGPFLEGADWGIEDWGDLLGDFDLRQWFLDTLRRSGKEPDWPEAQALEFYAQEYLCADGAAIEDMLEMGREELALMTAMNLVENVELLRPVLERMARSENPRVAAAVQAYLAEHGQATGRQWLN
ncbi:MAG: hypothetical protein FJW36_17060 [Acidobacteria bacterium]|nr:hypothetical protein [Acidobacteriota bacterium]